MIDLSIILVSWNTRDLIRDCLGSIFRHPPDFPWQAIVVDNASQDGSPELVSREFPAVQLIRNPSNLGFAAANNQGAGTASGRYLLFLNSDTLVHAGTLAGAVAFMEQHPEAGVMGCRTLNADGSLQATAFAFPGKFRVFAYVSGLNRIFKLSRFTDHSVLRTADYVQGSFLIMRKGLYDDCGGFDEHFFLYAEEVDLCLRVKAAGFSVYYFPAVSITHHGGGSGRDPLAALGHYMKSSIALYQKHRPLSEEQKLLRVMRAALRVRYFLEAVFSPQRFRGRKKAIKELRHDLALVHAEKTRDHAS
jgi:hypothetical protein